MDKNRDDIIRKLFERSLEPKERGELNNYEFINDALRKQWEEAPAIVDSVREERILHSVLKNVKRKTNYFNLLFLSIWNSCISSYMYVAFGVIICGERPSGSDLCCEYWISINGLSEISGWYKGDVGCR